MHSRGLIVALALFLLAGLFVWFLAGDVSPLTDLPRGSRDMKQLLVRGTPVDARLAVTREEQIRGLSGTQSLPDGEGLLFVYAEPSRSGIWMKDMNYPIDVLWISEEGKIVHIVENMRPESYPQAYYPDEDATYVLELPSGFVEIHGTQEGDTVEGLPR